jgi:hypothetical protein
MNTMPSTSDSSRVFAVARTGVASGVEAGTVTCTGSATIDVGFVEAPYATAAIATTATTAIAATRIFCVVFQPLDMTSPCFGVLAQGKPTMMKL